MAASPGGHFENWTPDMWAQSDFRRKALFPYEIDKDGTIFWMIQTFLNIEHNLKYELHRKCIAVDEVLSRQPISGRKTSRRVFKFETCQKWDASSISILGPIIFVVFINDILEVVENHCELFSNDLKRDESMGIVWSKRYRAATSYALFEENTSDNTIVRLGAAN